MNTIHIEQKPVKDKIPKKLPWWKWRRFEDSRRRNLHMLGSMAGSIEKRKTVERSRQEGQRLRIQAEQL